MGELRQTKISTREESVALEVAFWPFLTRFYGIPPSELARMSPVYMKPYIDAIRPISAIEQLLALEASAYPHLKKNDARAVARRHERAARRSPWGKPAALNQDPPEDKAAFVTAVTEMGIGTEGFAEERKGEPEEVTD